MSTKMGHVGSKTRSIGHILEKNCVRSRGHIFRVIIIKLGQKVCLDEIADEFENGQISETSCVRSRGHISRPLIMKLGQNVCLDKIANEFENGLYLVKN